MKKDKNIYLKPGDVFLVLPYDEPMRGTDLIREKYESPGMFGDGGWNKSFKPDYWSGTAWHTIKEEMPYWIGKTYGDFIKGGGEEHEIIRKIEVTLDK